MEIDSSNDTTVPVDLYYMRDAVHYITSIGTFLLVILSICADIALSIITRNFDNLTSRTSQWFKNFAVFHWCFLVLTHCVGFILDINRMSYSLPLNLYNFFLDMALAVLMLTAVAWYASHYEPFHQRYLNYFQRGIWMCFLLVLAEYITSIIFYFYGFRMVLASIRIIPYVFVIWLTVFISKCYEDPPNLNAIYTLYAFPCISLAMAFFLVLNKPVYSFFIDFMDYLGGYMFFVETMVILMMLVVQNCRF